MKKSLLFVAGLLVSSLAFAQSPAADKAQARADKRAAAFTASDANRDGKLDMTEWQLARSQHLARQFERMDRDKDGALTQDEMRAAKVTHRRGMHRHRGMAMRSRLKAMDTDQDQSLSRAEIGDRMPRLATHFDSIDLDNDGKLSREEMRAGRKALRQQAR